MRPRITVIAVALALGLSVLAFSAPASAAPSPFVAALNGANEVGGGDPDGAGTAEVTIDPASDEICWSVTYSNIDTVSMAHIHVGPAGTNGSVVVDFTSSIGPSPFGGCVVDADADAIAGNPANYYVNVHTGAFQAGAIRGQLGTTPPVEPLNIDHFACYAAGPEVAAGPAFTDRPLPTESVLLDDQFTDAPVQVQVGQLDRLCNPTDKILGPDNATLMRDPENHLVCWQMQRPFERREVDIRNQFGTNRLTVEAPERLCLPSFKTESGNLPPAPEAPTDLDHYACYRVNGPAVNPPAASLRDQFGPHQVEMIRPVELCNPVEKRIPARNEVTPIVNPDDHLVCYELVPQTVSRLPLARNQFGQGIVRIEALNRLCLPTFKTEIPDPVVPELAWVAGLPLSAILIAGGVIVLRRRTVKLRAV